MSHVSFAGNTVGSNDFQVALFIPWFLEEHLDSLFNDPHS